MSGEALMEDAGEKFIDALRQMKAQNVNREDVNFRMEMKAEVLDHLLKIAEERGSRECLDAYLKLFVILLQHSGSALDADKVIQLLDAMTL